MLPSGLTNSPQSSLSSCGDALGRNSLSEASIHSDISFEDAFFCDPLVSLQSASMLSFESISFQDEYFIPITLKEKIAWAAKTGIQKKALNEKIGWEDVNGQQEKPILIHPSKETSCHTRAKQQRVAEAPSKHLNSSLGGWNSFSTYFANSHDDAKKNDALGASRRQAKTTALSSKQRIEYKISALRSKSSSFNFAWEDSEGIEGEAQLSRVQRIIATEQLSKDYFMQKKFGRQQKHLRVSRAKRAALRKQNLRRERSWAVAVVLSIWFIRLSSVWKGRRAFSTTLRKVFIVQQRWREFVQHKKMKQNFSPIDWFVVAFCGTNCQSARFQAGVRNYCGKVIAIQRFVRDVRKISHARAQLMTNAFRSFELMAVRHFISRTSVHGIPVPSSVTATLATDLVVVPAAVLFKLIEAKLQRVYTILQRKMATWDDTFAPHAVEQLRVQLGMKRKQAKLRAEDATARGCLLKLLESLPDRAAALGCLPMRPCFKLDLVRVEEGMVWDSIQDTESREAKALYLHIDSNLKTNASGVRDDSQMLWVKRKDIRGCIYYTNRMDQQTVYYMPENRFAVLTWAEVGALDQRKKAHQEAKRKEKREQYLAGDLSIDGACP
jgi:hypothetical protein